MKSVLPSGNWYAVCTKPKTEKKVASLLAKQQIETYLPLKKTNKSWSFFQKTEAEPIFSSIVFVKVSEEKLSEIRKTNGVVNFLYWLNKPAVIRENDINLIKSFMQNHQDVRVGQVPVRTSSLVSVNAVEMDTQIGVERVSLSSLGYVLIADVNYNEDSKVKTMVVKNTPFLHSYRDAS